MLLQYSSKNFYSFLDEVVVDFTLSSKAALTHGAVLSDSGLKAHTVLGIFGANASGKTNLLKPLALLSYLFLESAKLNPKDLIPLEGFNFVHEAMPKPSEFMVEFEFENLIYRYEIHLTNKRITQESLSQKKGRFAYLFKRSWNEAKQAYDFKSQGIGSTAHVPLRENAAWLSCALLQEHELAMQLLPYIKSMTGNLDIHGRETYFDGNYENVFRVTDYYAKNPHLLEKASQYMAKLDLGLSKVNLTTSKQIEPDGKERELELPWGIHELNGTEYFLPMVKESRGTQTLFVLLTYILHILENGGIAYIDEFESGLHPHMVQALIELFLNPGTNPQKAQLIATFHSDFLLRDTFHKSQIYLVEKDQSLQSQAYRLDDIKGIRTVDNIFEKYHAGAYGGIPNFM